jgi:hypothetical protein
MPADGFALRDHDPAATTALRGRSEIGGGIDAADPASGAYCLVRQEEQERRPVRIVNALSTAGVLDRVAGLHVLMIDHVVLAYQRERRLVVDVRSLATACAALRAMEPDVHPPALGEGEDAITQRNSIARPL